MLEDLSNREREKLDVVEKHGILVDDVISDGPAKEAGIEEDDILLMIEGEKIYTTDQVISMMGGFEKDQEVAVDIIRDGEYKSYSVTLDEADDHGFPNLGNFDFDFDFDFDFNKDPGKVLVCKFQNENEAWLGVVVENLDNEVLVEAYGVESGVHVIEVFEDSPAEKEGLLVGDIITAIDGTNITSVEDLVNAVGEEDPGDILDIEVMRNGEAIGLSPTLEKNEGGESETKRVEVTIDGDELNVIVNGEESSVLELHKLIPDLPGLSNFSWHNKAGISGCSKTECNKEDCGKICAKFHGHDESECDGEGKKIKKMMKIIEGEDGAPHHWKGTHHNQGI